MGRLTTHVLDTANGRPAAGVGIRVYRLDLDGARRALASEVTNADGRTTGALLEGEGFAAGRYELEFDIGAYFAQTGAPAGAAPFLDVVVVRVRLDGESNYHVPLLASPWSYTTYRGS